MKWPIDKWTKLSWRRKKYDVEIECDSFREAKRRDRKKLIVNGTVEVYFLSGKTYGVKVHGMCVGLWSSAQRGHDIMDTVFDTVMIMERECTGRSNMKKIFDKKFVYLEWDEVLKGKELFVADTLPELRRRVDNDSIVFKRSVKENDDDNYEYPFVTSDGEVCYAMAYYDPNYSCKLAYMQGKKIQCKSSRIPNDKWEDCVRRPEWVDHCEYRVKPEEPEKKWRPFKDIQELKDTWLRRRYNTMAILNPLEEPMIWVRSKSNKNITVLISCFDHHCSMVFIFGMWIDMRQLFDDYTFLDESPCGVEE